ncbi:MAG: SIS domain-containing protein [Egibacteraceae bacterium]
MRGAQMTHEMNDQPQVLAAIAGRRDELVSELSELVGERPAGVVLIARGSSDHAAVYGRYVLELAAGRPVALAAPSLHTLYGADVDYSGYLAVAVSQSGQTPEITTVLEAVRRAGATGVAITNEASSPLAEEADAVIDLQAGEEQAVPATKTFTAQVAAFALLAEALGDVPWADEDWQELPDAVQRVLDDERPAAAVAEAIGEAPGLIVAGRGFCYGIALEVALKLKETCGLHAQGYSAADLRHGPIAVVEQDFPVLVLRTSGPTADDLDDLVVDLRNRGGQVFVAGTGDGVDLPVSDGLAEALVTMPLAVRGQQVARELARWRGLDPDNPEGLSKVTITH